MKIDGEAAQRVAVAEAELEAFQERYEKEHQSMQDHFKDVVCSAFGIPKEDYTKFEFSLTTKYYSQFGFMILEKDQPRLHDLFSGLNSEDLEEMAEETSNRILN